MDAKQFNVGLANLREVRDEIKPLERQLAKLQAELEKLQAKRDQQIRTLAPTRRRKRTGLRPQLESR
ncbi:hypothetical protein ACFQ6Q_31280 [Streptomyces sp. NPDC056437]|uniref:hypothetical protein n=1 Tax=Streptomyces sp. NPDC056437 TaxID=3345816 RepID=UPI00368FAAD6